jgi:DNA-binding transcriptional MerR regulator/SAM-dependent methyltransferase
VKIGKFAELNRLSIDTIRHYMDVGLIMPEKKGGQYSFDLTCQKDLDDILDLKNMGFSLGEIKIIFLYKSLSRLAPDQENLYYKAFFTDKLRKIEDDIRELAKARARLEDKLRNQINNPNTENNISGIDIRILNLFRCIKCNKGLALYDAAVNNNQIISGKLKCGCGCEYTIDSGILRVGKQSERPDGKLDNNYILEYVSRTDNTYLDNLRRGLEWGKRKIGLCSLNNKVILELGTGIGFFLRFIYDELPEDCVYVAVDHSIERHKFLKSLLECSTDKKNVIFVCSDFLEIPIRERSADIILDISGTSNYSFNHQHFLLDLVDNVAREDAYLYGSYILFKGFSKNSLIDRQYRKNFMLENVKDRIRALGYGTLDERISDFVDKGGKYEDYFVDGEKVCTYSIFAKR